MKQLFPKFFSALLLALFAMQAAIIQAHPNTEGEPALESRVEVVKDGEQWTATFHFPSDEEGWGFPRSNKARESGSGWRVPSWTVETEGVSLRRIGEKDVLVADESPNARTDAKTVPRIVKVRFQPFGKDVLADYDPALIFSDGTIALFTGHFDVRAWSHDDGMLENKRIVNELYFRDAAGPITYKGNSYKTATTQDTVTYVIFGEPEFLTTPHMTALIDPQMPGWMSQELTDFLPQTFAQFSKRLGSHSGSGKPMVLASWAGPTPGKVSFGGSALPNLISARLEGEGMLERSQENLHRARWFIAHEAGHFWLGQTVDHASPADAWISEGGADMLAYRLIQSTDPNYNPGSDLELAWDDCAKLVQGKSLSTAYKRNEYRANYACGDILALVAEGAARQNGGRDFFDFAATLIEKNRKDKGGDGIISVDEWLAQLTAESGNPSLAKKARILIEEGADDPKALMCSMLASVQRTMPDCPMKAGA